MASLFVIQGYDQGRRYELDEDSITIGRDRTNAFRLEDTEISRQHVEIKFVDSEYHLTDLNSSNGTYVNNQEVKSCELTNGDRVQLGRTLMIFTQADQLSGTNSSMVDIVGKSANVEESKIIKSISHEEGSQIFMLPTEKDSVWLDTARNNLQLMYHTALAVSRTLDIDQLLDYILGLVFDWIEADRGCIMLNDLETGTLEAHAHRERNERKNSETEPLQISRTILDYVLEHKEGVLTSDASDDQRWDAGGSIINVGVREAICVPMQGRYGIVGVIYVDTSIPPRQFD